MPTDRGQSRAESSIGRRGVLAHPALVVGAWLLLTVAGIIAAPRLIDALSYSFDLPGSEAFETNMVIAREHGGGGSFAPIVVVASGSANSMPEFTRLSAELTGALESMGGRVASTTTDSDEPFYRPDSGIGYLLAYLPAVPGPEPTVASAAAVEGVIAQIAPAFPGVDLQVVQSEQLSETSASEGDRPIIFEILLGAVGALLVLLLVFRSVLALVPLLAAAVAISTTFLATYLLVQAIDVTFVVQYLIGLIGLGVAIDYTLLIVMRWREERHHGRSNTEAVRHSVSTAGHAVLFSGLTVAISLTALLFVPLPFLRSVGIAGLLIPLFSVLVALTLLPVILDRLGPRLDRLGLRTSTDTSSPAWERIGRTVVRHRVVAAVIATAVLILLALPVLGLRLGTPEATAEGRSPETAAVLTTLTDGGPGTGVLRPTELLIDGDPTETVAQLRALPGVDAVVTSDRAGWVVGDRHVVEVVTGDDPSSTAGAETVARIRAIADADDAVRIGGTAAEDDDRVEAIYGSVALPIAGIALLTFVLLAYLLRSIWLPIKALVLNVISTAAAYGVTVWIWQEGHGSELLFGLPATGALPTWIPIAVFAFLFGLSMDYEVFILSRIREEYLVSGSTAEATVAGLARTGRLVTSGALILFFAFVALATVPVVDVKIMATALAVGILIDATIVRGILAPALVALLDAANWWFPFTRSAAPVQ